MEFKLKHEFIELDNLLKAAGLVETGSEAKQYILANAIKVNGHPETRIRRKLRIGDKVEFGKNIVAIV